ncbi:MAG TPA: NTP transferase domain-containing protein, partial [Solirubrobacterales bacterium]|nr:NTP transferase domain-containing protein [Solirubrobacterales bacterium]
PATIRALIATCDEGTALAACLYDDGRGHPLAFGKALFGELRDLHGDKAVWKLIDRLADQVVEVRTPGSIPPDVDTREDYEAILAEAGTSA